MLWGFGNHHETEAVKGALPIGQNSPQQCSLGLYAEQLSGTAFTMLRHQNQRTWLYRRLPSVCHRPFQMLKEFKNDFIFTPNQLRWDPFVISTGVDWVDGLRLIAGAGEESGKNGLKVFVYGADQSMVKRAFYSSDGDWLIVPQQGDLTIRTEMGLISVAPLEIAVIPRGIKFTIGLQGASRGYCLEVFNGHWELPDLGPIGANGLANPQDFAYPEASYAFDSDTWQIVNKYGGNLWQAEQDHCPYDVVAWRDRPGQAIADFVIFPPRWAVAQHTFRPPYFHRNVMSEFMGLIKGSYEAKREGEFASGGASLHSIGTPHGPDAQCYAQASKAELKPERVAEGTMAFMFETCLMMGVCSEALAQVQPDYWQAWSGMQPHFSQY